MIKLGITGSIAMGKSEAAKVFKNNNVPVFDSDACVHQLFESNKTLREKIQALWPQAVVDKKIDRKKLGEVVFSSIDLTKKLEKIIHPLVQKEQENFLNQHKGRATLVVFDIPLLFETGAEKRLDKTLLISAPKHVQQKRALKREGMTMEKFEAILARQMPDQDKQKLADYVISSANGKEAMQKDIEALINNLMSPNKGHKHA